MIARFRVGQLGEQLGHVLEPVPFQSGLLGFSRRQHFAAAGGHRASFEGSEGHGNLPFPT